MAQTFKKDLAQAIASRIAPHPLTPTDPSLNDKEYFESKLCTLANAKDTIRNLELAEFLDFSDRLQFYWDMKVSEKDIEELTGITRYTQTAARKVRLALQDYSEHIYKLRETTVRMLYRLTNRQILACHP